jgi:hypothetical protein
LSHAWNYLPQECNTAHKSKQGPFSRVGIVSSAKLDVFTQQR